MSGVRSSELRGTDGAGGGRRTEAAAQAAPGGRWRSGDLDGRRLDRDLDIDQHGGTDTGGISTALTGGGGGGGSSGFTSLMISALIGSVIASTNLVANPLFNAHSSSAWNSEMRAG